ncbi:MAG: hypothetical protein KKD86_16430 [Bacteroidetes bacterium]|nr:hypothetical protein [Bacteroidota bacterium]
MTHRLIKIFLIIFSISIYGQWENHTFQHITIEDGLSQSSIFSILQDSKGFMWFGTTDGLNKYDGYNFTIYYSDETDSNSISGNSVTKLLEGSEGFIWIGTNEGVLNRFSRKDESFIHYNYNLPNSIALTTDDYFSYPLSFSRNSANTITAITEDDENNLWIGTWGKGLVYFNKTSGAIKHYYNIPSDSGSLSSNRVTDIVKDKSGIVWISTLNGGLNKLIGSPESNDVKFISYKTINSSNGISSNQLIALFNDKYNSLWIGSFRSGVSILNSDQKQLPLKHAKFITYSNSVSNPQSISNNSVMSIIEDDYGEIWLGTFGGGLNYFDRKSNSFFSYKNDPFNENSIADNDVLSLNIDKSGVIWIGTHLGKGLSKLERNSVKFGLMQREIGNSNSLSDDVVWAIYEDENEILWLGTYKGGLNKVNRRKNLYTSFKQNPKNLFGIGDNHIRSITQDFMGNLWIGTYNNGLNFFDKISEKFLRLSGDSAINLDGNQVQSLFISGDSTLWIGIFGGGLASINLKDFYEAKSINLRTFKNNPVDNNSLSDNRVYTIVEDANGELWIGTYGGGLNKFDEKSKQFVSYKNTKNNRNSISSNNVLTIFEDSEGNLWIGTSGGGLNRFDKKTESFERFTIKHGIKSKVIYGILEDNRKNLWFSSDNGLFKYNMKNADVTYFDLKDGLQSMEFSGGAYFKNSTGEMFFGGINGVNHFFPDSVKGNIYIPPIVISEFKIFNERVKGEVEDIALSYTQNFFSFEFSALDYTNPGDNQYAYILEGLETGWHYTDALLRRANYTNLEPGKYIFRVKGSNNDGVWNHEGISVKVEILPPFWKTWWFMLLSIITIGSVVSFLISMRVKHLLAIEKLKLRLAADLHDNVGAGLTEISILSELASKEIKSMSKNASDKLNNISTIARHLVDSMSDIVWFVNPKRDSLYDLIIRLTDSYSDLLHEIGISFKTINLENIVAVKIPMDVRQNLYLIFKEGINNSIKHSKCKKINLETKLKNSVLEMTLYDDGIGIPENSGSLGNGLKNMISRARNMGGQLNIVSENQTGTKITFTGNIGTKSILKYIWGDS